MSDALQSNAIERQWEVLIGRLLSADEANLETLIVENHTSMDHAGFFERLRERCQGDSRQGERFRHIVEQHLRLDQGPAADYLLLCDALLTAQTEGNMQSFLAAEPRCREAEFLDVLIVSAEHATAAAGQLDLAGHLISAAEALLDYPGLRVKQAELELVKSGYLLTLAWNDEAAKAIDAARRAEPGDATREALDVNEGLLLFRLGEYRKAADFMGERLASIKDPQRQRQMMANLALCYTEMGWYGESEGVLRALIQQCEDAGDAIGLGRALGNLAVLYRSLGLFDDERRLLEESLVQARAMPQGHKLFDWNNLITNYANLCLSALRVGESEQAETYLARFRESADAYGAEPYLLTYARLRLELDVHRGQLPKALGVIRWVQENLSAREDYEYLAFLGKAAEVHQQSGDASAAKSFLEQLQSLAVRSGHGELVMQAALALSVLHLDAGRVSQGMELLHSAMEKERNLRGHVGESWRQFDYTSTQQGLHRRILKSVLESGDTSTLYQVLQFTKSRATHYLRGADTAYNAACFPEGVTAVEFCIRDSFAFALLVGRHHESPTIVRLNCDAEQVASWAKCFADEIPFAWMSDTQAFAGLEEYARVLLWPLLAHLSPATSLVMCASGGLYELPIHLFPLPPDRSEGQSVRLIERWPVSYAPTASIMLHCVEQRASSSDAKVICSSAPDDSASTRDAFQREAETVARELGVSSERDRTDAVESLLSSRALHALHIACHGSFHGDTPLSGGLSLRTHDGMQTVAAEALLGRERVADLVFLSGCDTGRTGGRLGDERLGLMSALLAGGTSTLILSGWPVLAEHPCTLQVVVGFYRYWLIEAMPRAEALRRAMLDCRDQSSPYVWGAFTLHGTPL